MSSAINRCWAAAEEGKETKEGEEMNWEKREEHEKQIIITKGR